MTVTEREYLVESMHLVHDTTMRLQALCQYMQDRLPAPLEIKAQKEAILEAFKPTLIAAMTLLAARARDLELLLEAASASIQ